MLDLVKLNPQFSALCRQAIATWGTHAQVDMVIEECAELIHVLQKFKRDQATENNVIFEAIDVRLMLAQLEFIMAPASDLWERAATFKIEKLRQKLADVQPQGVPP